MLFRRRACCAFPERIDIDAPSRGVKRAAFCFALIIALALNAHAAEIIPPHPAHYFNDYAGIVSQSSASEFDQQLEQFERDTSNQVVVAIFQKMQSDDDIAAYTQRVAESWGVGQKDKRNGIVLFAFVEDRKMIIQVGYGLEGALPDLESFNIKEYQMKPKFEAGKYEARLRIGIDSILKAVAGSTARANKQFGAHVAIIEHPPLLFLLLFIPLSLLFGLHRTASQGVGISSKGTHWTIDWGNVIFFWLNLLLSSSSRSSSGSSSSSGGFSGGGGSFGGGGAGSSW
jgi:uncharacterized protein